MSKAYNPEEIELKWQKKWEDAHCFEAEASHEKPKFYALIEFPYPSGAGLHVGHPRSNTAMDIIARKRRMEGYNVLFPIGWDAFGLPTENYAIKNHVHPAGVTKKNIDHFREQLKRIGFSFDWTREVNTTDPNYFKWTQWIFLQLYKNGLAHIFLACSFFLTDTYCCYFSCHNCQPFFPARSVLPVRTGHVLYLSADLYHLALFFRSIRQTSVSCLFPEMML